MVTPQEASEAPHAIGRANSPFGVRCSLPNPSGRCGFIRGTRRHGAVHSSSSTMPASDFADRPSKKLVLFDVDGTLSLARRVRNMLFATADLALTCMYRLRPPRCCNY